MTEQKYKESKKLLFTKATLLQQRMPYARFLIQHGRGKRACFAKEKKAKLTKGFTKESNSSYILK